MSLFEKVYPFETKFEKIKKEDSKLQNFIYDLIHKEKVYPFSLEGVILMKQDNLKYKFFKFNERFELQYLAVAIGAVLLLAYTLEFAPYWIPSLMGLPFMDTLQSIPVAISPYERADRAGAKIVELGQYGIKKLSMAVVFYGLYLQLLKKDDGGKKIAVGAGITYIMSLLVPAVYDMLDLIFK